MVEFRKVIGVVQLKDVVELIEVIGNRGSKNRSIIKIRSSSIIMKKGRRSRSSSIIMKSRRSEFLAVFPAGITH